MEAYLIIHGVRPLMCYSSGFTEVDEDDDMKFVRSHMSEFSRGELRACMKSGYMSQQLGNEVERQCKANKSTTSTMIDTDLL